MNKPLVSVIIPNYFISFIQWEKGIRVAKGDLCWIVESDDYCELNMLEELVKAYNVQDNTVIAYSAVMFVDDKGNFCKKKDIPKSIFYT